MGQAAEQAGCINLGLENMPLKKLKDLDILKVLKRMLVIYKYLHKKVVYYRKISYGIRKLQMQHT